MTFLTVPIQKLRLGNNISRRLKRVNIHTQEFKDFAQTVKDKGIINPITVKEEIDSITKEVFYTILAGERRYRAALLHHFTEVPINIRKSETNIEELFTNAIENESRLDLSHAEKSVLYCELRNELMKQCGMNKRQAIFTLADKLRKSPADIEKLIKIREKLIPELFRAFEGRGGIPLTVVEASTYAALTPDEQSAKAAEWLSYGGRKAPDYDIRAKYRPIIHQPVGRLKGIQRQLAKQPDKALYWPDGLLVDTESLKRLVNWFLSKRDEGPFKE